MAVDFGEARTGLAICDSSELLASPAGLITERDFEKTVLKTAQRAAELGAEEIVVGHPLNMNATAGERAERCAAFADRLREATGLPVRLWDERGTTLLAASYLNVTDTRGKKRKKVIDEVAAVIILEGYLNYRKSRK